MKRGTIIIIASLIGIFTITVITMDVYSVVYDQKNTITTDELFLNSLAVALPGYGWDTSYIYRPLSIGAIIEYSIELNASYGSFSVGFYFIEIDDWEPFSMVSDLDNYTYWLETNTDKWNGGIIKSRSSIRTRVTGKIKPTTKGEYMIIGINVFQLVSYKADIDYKINTGFNLVSTTFVDIAKSSFGIIIPVATVILIIDRLSNLVQKNPRKKPKKEKPKKKEK
ncbi:MAG: hypothetical protein FK733_09150 [Asgard group archaeon]|nr:hypothetical protein [Asgard group archaeon]